MAANQDSSDADQRVIRDALNYIKHVGANWTMRGEPHPQQQIVDGLERILSAPPPTTESEKIADLKRQLAGERDHGKRLQQQLDAILRTDSAVNDSAKRVSEDTARIVSLQKAVEAKQAVIDRLMLEYCPDEMTPEQIENWKKHQRAATPEEEAAIDAAMASQPVSDSEGSSTRPGE